LATADELLLNISETIYMLVTTKSANTDSFQINVSGIVLKEL